MMTATICSGGGRVEEDRGGGVDADEADQREQAAEQDLHDVVAGDGGGEAFAGVFAAAGAEDPDDGERHEASGGMDDGCASAIGEGGQVKEGAELAEPASAADPVSEEGIREGGEDGGGDADGAEPPAVGAGRDGDDGGQAGGEEVKAEDERGARVGCRIETDAAREERFCSKQADRDGRASVISSDCDEVRQAAREAGEGEAEDDEGDGGDSKGAEGREHGVGGGTRAAQALMDDRQAGSGERHQHERDEAEHESHGCVPGRRAWSDLYSWARSARPRSSTPTPARTKIMR